jgi:hypothetical protein
VKSTSQRLALLEAQMAALREEHDTLRSIIAQAQVQRSTKALKKVCANCDRAIDALNKLAALRGAEEGRGRNDGPADGALRYSPGMSLRFALEEGLRLKREPQSTQQLLAMLKGIQFQFRGKRPYAALFQALKRSPQRGGSIVKVGKALWGLKEWDETSP